QLPDAPPARGVAEPAGRAARRPGEGPPETAPPDGTGSRRGGGGGGHRRRLFRARARGQPAAQAGRPPAQRRRHPAGLLALRQKPQDRVARRVRRQAPVVARLGEAPMTTRLALLAALGLLAVRPARADEAPKQEDVKLETKTGALFGVLDLP